MTVSERFTSFLQHWKGRGVPDEVLHEAKRLVLNQLKASVGATDHPAVRIIHDWAAQGGPELSAPGAAAHVLWFGTRTAPERAAVVNGALFEVLDFHDTYIPTFMHAVSAVLPAVLARAEAGGHSGRDMLNALAVGLEVELACATILMPTGYYRGYVPAGLVGGVGAAAACSALAGFDERRMRNALGIAMCTAFGVYEAVGSGTLAYITGATARSGLTAVELAERGLDAPRTAFEGEKAMFVTHCDEKAEKIEEVLDSLGKTWRILGQTYKTVPTETITHAPVELVLELRERASNRSVKRMKFGVAPIVVKIVKERMERFGNPSSDLTARFDLCYCAAAAWHRGCFTLDEMREPAYTDPAILGLRSKIELVADPDRETFDGGWLEIEFTDGSTERASVDAFLGTPANRMTDAQLSEAFRLSARDLLPANRVDEILAAVWGLDKAPDVRKLMSLAMLRRSLEAVGA